MRTLFCAFLLIWSGPTLAQDSTPPPTQPAPGTDSAAAQSETPKPVAAPKPEAKKAAAAPAKVDTPVPAKVKVVSPGTNAPKKQNAKKAKKTKNGVVLYKKGRLKVTAHVLGTMTAEHVDPFVIDALGSERQLDTIFDARGRGGLTLEYRKNKFENLKFEYEHDGWTGPITEVDQTGVDLVLAPNSELGDHELRKLSIKGRKELLFGGAGFMLSHWGMGLIANDGAHGWKPGSGRIVDPRSGDRVLRGFAGLGPFPGIGLTILGGYDHMIKDDVLLEEDEGHQGIVALLVDPRKANRGGVYAAFRTHEHPDGKKTEVTAIDFHLRLEGRLNRALSMIAETESAYITGTSELGPNVEHPVHDVRQFGNATRFTLKGKTSGLSLDFLFASGDQNYDDNELNAFKADRNFDTGMILFRHLMASTSARTPVLGSDPDLVGYPSSNLDRIPTRGGATNTRSFFPRAWWNPIRGVEVYGGVLMAMSDVKQANPFYSRLGGGAPRNHLDGEPGPYLGTEYDAGIRVFMKRSHLKIRFAIEGAHFVPGDAFTGASGETLSPITAMRSIFEVQI